MKIININSLLLFVIFLVSGCIGGKIQLTAKTALTSQAVFKVNPPYSYDFGNIPVGNTSEPKDIVITNSGTSPASECAEPVLSGPNANLFSFTTDCQQQQGLGDSNSCKITVTATPNSANNFYAKIARNCNIGGNVIIDLYVTGTTLTFGINSVSINGGDLYTSSPSLSVGYTTFGTLSGICIQESSDDSLCTFSSDVTSPNAYSLTDVSDGNKTLYIWGKNSEGTLTSVVTSSIILDSVTPQDPVVPNPPANITNTDPITFTYTSGVDNNFLYNNVKLCTSAGCSSNCTTAVTSTTDSILLSGVPDGNYYLCVQTVDYAGSSSNYKESASTFTIDNTPPSILSFTLDSGNTFSADTTVDASYTFDSTPDSICLQTGSDVGTCAWNSSFNATSEIVTLPAVDGSHTVYLWARDVGGNTSANPSTDSILLDNTNPTDPSSVNVPSTYSSTTSNSFTFTSGTDANFSHHLVRACQNTDCVTSCVGDTSGAASPIVVAGMANGVSYYACVQAVDLAGKTSSFARSAGTVTIDTVNPADPSVDNPPTYSTTGAYSLTWTASTDINFDRFNVRVCTNNNCTTGCAIDTTDSASPYAVTGLSDGTFYSCVQEQDLAGRTSNFIASATPIIVDLTNPTVPATVSDPTLYSMNTSEAFSFTDGTDANFSHYLARACTGADCTTGCVGDATGTSSPITVASMANGTTYYACVQMVDLSGRTSGFTKSTGTTTIDTIDPADPTVDDPPAYSTTGGYSLTWTASTDINFERFNVRVCTNNNCTTGCAIDTTDSASPYTVAGLSDGTSYYSCVQERDLATRFSSFISSSTQVVVDLTDPTDVTVDNPPSDSSSGAYSMTWTGGADVNFSHFKVRVCTNNDCVTGCAIDTTDSASPYAVTGLADNTYYSCVAAEDLAGRSTAYFPSNSTIDVDTVAPTLTSFSIENNTGTTSDTFVSITFVTGLSPYEICIQESSDKNACSWSTDLSSPHVHNLNVSAIGTKTIYGWVRDRAHNVSTPDASDSIIFDNSKTVTSARGGDDISGDVGNDILIGGIGTNTINGNAGNDILYADGEVMNPNSYGKLFYWFDAGKMDTIKVNQTDDVIKWYNRGKAGYHNLTTSATGNYPNYKRHIDNGRSTAYFNNVYYGAFYEPMARNNYTFFTVHARTSVLATQFLLGSIHGSTSTNNMPHFGYSLDTNIRMGQYSNDIDKAISGFSTKEFVFMTHQLNSSGRFLNYSKDYANPGTTATTTQMQELETDYIATGFAPGSHYLVGDFAELLIFSTDLTTDAVTSIEDYLSMKWGIVNSDYPDGPDTLTGGSGNNVFVWTNASNSSNDNPDSITDFTQGNDYIYLQGFDNHLSYIGSNAFNGFGQGEVRVTDGVSPSYVYIDFEGDGTTDMTIQVDGNLSFTESDIRIGFAHGTSSPDTIYGGFGNDTLIGGYGGDTIYGGDGDDIIVPDNRKIDKDTFPELMIWYDPSNMDGSGAVQANASSVTSLSDLSGNNYTIGTGVAPTYYTNGTGYPYIGFDGASQYLTGSVSGLHYDDHSWFYAHTPTDGGAWQGLIVMSNNGGAYDGEHVDGYNFITGGGAALIWGTDKFGGDPFNVSCTAHNGSNLPTYTSLIFNIDASTHGDFYNVGSLVASDDGSNNLGMSPFCIRMGTRTTCAANVNLGGHNFYQHYHYKRAMTRYEQRRIEELMAYKTDTSFDGYYGGADILYGEGGADTFVYSNASASKSGADNRDIIMDFSQAEGDKILLEGFPGAFDFMGSGTLAGSKRQVSFENLTGGSCSTGNDPCTVIYVDVDKDNSAEIEIELAGTITLTRSDFVSGSLSEALDSALLWLDPAKANASGDAPYTNGCAAGDLTWYDLSGNGFDGTLESFASCGASSGWVGNGTVATPYALAFDGANDRVNLGKILKFQGKNTFSVSMWVKDSDVAGLTAYLGCIAPGGSYEGWALYSSGSALLMQLEAAWSTNCIQASSTTTLDATWHHIAFTYSGSETSSGIKFYIDGADAGSTSAFNNLVADTDAVYWASDFYIGARNSSQNYFNGQLGVSFVFGKVLTLTEIQELCLRDELTYTASRGDICTTPSY